MNYKRYWWALAIVIVGSFMVLGGEGRKMIGGAPPLADVYTTDGQLLSLAVPSRMDRACGSPSVGRRSAPSGPWGVCRSRLERDWLHRESEFC